ncbi:transposase [Wolbachia endosymbiont of Pentalonia nigronervosa]|uniref:transposase n=1 Tax=Wolbachia endosymbiont of Pentalonia nigronervosa TaxID=1301914 RepID=UPI00165F7677|nr:transposase [Wolbachia endosymbiont of Pentalonia nigronervosa]MBD0391463.1 transposase [Wolbachia endosymbiont of Pentalonia nigronervosa]
MKYYIQETKWKQIFANLKSVKGIHSKDEDRLRKFMEAIWYIVRSGCQWQLLPEIYGNYRSVHKRFKKWCERGIWELKHYVSNSTLVADKGYDSNAFVASLESKGCEVVIPPKRNRKVQRYYDEHIYKERECFFGEC